jgi:hypothetical protein
VSGRAKCFEAAIYRVGALRCVDVSTSVSKTFGEGQRTPVRVTIGGVEEQTSLVPKRGGGHRLFLGAAVRKAAGINTGDRVRIEVRPDPRSGEPDLPPALAEALRRTVGAMDEFLSRSPADRRQLVRWVDEPKSPQARRNRVEKVIRMVLRGKPDPKPRKRES